jgi:hypothetical protein
MRKKTVIRHTAVATLLLTASLVAQAQQWVEYRPAGAGYRIEFPEPPTVAPTQTGSFRMFVASVERGTEAFMATYCDCVDGSIAADPEDVLDIVRDGGIENAQGRLREERRLTIGGATARRIVFDIQWDNRVGVALIVLSGTQLYQAIVVTPAGGENSVDSERFLSSFALVPLR